MFKPMHKFNAINDPLKVIGVRPMAPVLNNVHLKVYEHEMFSFGKERNYLK